MVRSVHRRFIAWCLMMAIGTLRKEKPRGAKVEAQRAERERELEEQRAQDEALQAYLDQMSTLLLEKDLSDDKVRTLLRARTLTVLERLDPSRKTQVMRFLLEADLVQNADERVSIIALAGADLRGADLDSAILSGADLREADLRDAQGVTNKELEQQARSLEGATMHNGQKYEDWLKE